MQTETKAPITLFLDLEGTVIDSWENPYLKNVSRVANWIATLRPADVHIFSFAVAGARDVDIVRRSIAPMLETALNIKIGDIHDKWDVFATIGRPREALNDPREFMKCHDKNWVFPLWLRRHYGRLPEERHFILLDDHVNDFMVDSPDNHIIETVNVNSI